MSGGAMTEAIRFAIAGVGLVGRRHVQAIRQLKNVVRPESNMHWIAASNGLRH
jgi:hypothetical protein